MRSGAQIAQRHLRYIHRRIFPDRLERLLDLPPLVCRQFNSDSTDALYASTAFVFHEPHAFRTFALSSHTHVEKLQYLTISRSDSRWENVLTASMVGRLKSLRGVRPDLTLKTPSLCLRKVQLCKPSYRASIGYASSALSATPRHLDLFRACTRNLRPGTDSRAWKVSSGSRGSIHGLRNKSSSPRIQM